MRTIIAALSTLTLTLLIGTAPAHADGLTRFESRANDMTGYQPSLYEGRWDVYRICAPCVAASEALTDACRLYDATTYAMPVGALRDALDEHLRGEGWRTGHAPEGIARTALRDLNRHNIRLNGRRKVTA